MEERLVYELSVVGLVSCTSAATTATSFGVLGVVLSECEPVRVFVCPLFVLVLLCQLSHEPAEIAHVKLLPSIR